MANLLAASIGLVGHGLAVYGKHINVPDALANPAPTRILGRFVWLTVQTNTICTVYFAVAVSSCLWESEALSTIVTTFYPLAFALGFVLSMLYYGLDHFNPDNIKSRKHWTENGYPQIRICCHLEHGSSTPVALLFAFTLKLPFGPAPSVQPVLAFLCWYICMSLANHAATGAWQYTIIREAKEGAGWIGVILFFALIAGIVVASAFLGLWIAS